MSIYINYQHTLLNKPEEQRSQNITTSENNATTIWKMAHRPVKGWQNRTNPYGVTFHKINLPFFILMHVPCSLYSLLSRPTNAQHIYIYIYILIICYISKALLHISMHLHNLQEVFNLLTPNGDYSGRTAPLTSKFCILYVYSTNRGIQYFEHGIYSPIFPLQNAVCFINLTYLVPVLFTFYLQGVLKLKK